MGGDLNDAEGRNQKKGIFTWKHSQENKGKSERFLGTDNHTDGTTKGREKLTPNSSDKRGMKVGERRTGER